MTTDHDPRELREAAERCRDSMAIPRDTVDMVADYILATVRDDDGEEQPDVMILFGDRHSVRVQRKPAAIWVAIDTGGDCVQLSFASFTRGQFRDLCRGLGIIEPTRE